MQPSQLSIGKKPSNSPHELPALYPNALLHKILNTPPATVRARESARFVSPSGMEKMCVHFELSQACLVNASQVGHLNLDSLQLPLASVVGGHRETRVIGDQDYNGESEELERLHDD